MDSFSDTLYHYSMKYRGIVKADGEVTVYTERGSFPCTAEMEFDSKKDTDTAVNYFSAALLSGILHGILSYMKKDGNPLEEVEAKARVVLDHPLSYLSVKGYEETPRIAKVKVDLYFYSFLEEEEVLAKCREALKKNILYQTLSPTVDIEISYHLSL